jgi:SAM-dependent methyltransferase
MDKTKLREFYDRLAPSRERWRAKNSFYHREISRYYRFHVQPGSSVLDLGCETGDLLASLKPSRGLGVDISGRMVEVARERYPDLEFRCDDAETFETGERFDYVIVSGTVGEVDDIQLLLERILSFTTSDTRIVVKNYNRLWQGILRAGERLHLKMPEYRQNWLSIEDLENLLKVTNYDVIRKDFFLLMPVNLGPISNFLNKAVAKLPLIRRLCLVQFLVARVLKPPDNVENLTTSVVITCRDERESIEPLVQGIPEMGKHTEIIFVEGHSVDGTREEIGRVIEAYPDKDIKLLIQDGIGQGDAFRKGYDNAQGDFVLWLEADMTTPPGELWKFWDAYAKGTCEYANGTRLVYEMEKGAMPTVNLLGNRFFGNLFTWLLGQRFTDTLCGLKAISARNYHRIRSQIDFFGDFDPFGDFELIFGAVKNDLRVAEIPVKYRPREYGTTKTKPFGHGWLLVKMAWNAYVKFKLF